jgi:hypothetical protein
LYTKGDGALDLVGHHTQIAASLANCDEIQRDEMRTGIDENLRGIAGILCIAAKPGAAMDEHEDRRVRPAGAVEVELLNRRRTIGETTRLAQPRARGGAIARAPRADLPAQGRVDRLIVGGVKLHLIQIHPDRRTFVVCRRADVAAFLLRECARRRHDGCGAEHGAAGDALAHFAVALHGVPRVGIFHTPIA